MVRFLRIASMRFIPAHELEWGLSARGVYTSGMARRVDTMVIGVHDSQAWVEMLPDQLVTRIESWRAPAIISRGH